MCTSWGAQENLVEDVPSSSKKFSFFFCTVCAHRFLYGLLVSMHRRLLELALDRLLLPPCNPVLGLP